MEALPDAGDDIVELCRPFLKGWIKTIGEAGKDGDVRAAVSGLDLLMKAMQGYRSREVERVVEEIRRLREESLATYGEDGHEANRNTTSGTRPVEPDEA